MFGGLIISASLGDAFEGRGLVFGAVYAIVQIGRPAFAVVTLGDHPDLQRNFQRILVWRTVAGVLWVAGGVALDTEREVLWLAAVVIDLVAAASGFLVPRLGRSLTTDWHIAGGHLAERCRLFIILALGESILVTGANFGELPTSTKTFVAFFVAFIGSIALWWIYFDRADDGARRIIAESSDPGRLGRSAYTYFHLPMVAGIIASAAADEVTIAHPTEAATASTTALILGGPAIYLLGNVLFKWTLWRHVPRSRFVAFGALAVLIPFAAVSSVLVLSIAATIVLVAVAVSDSVAKFPSGAGVESPTS
jgi:low temperature requirement protein LtrA